MHAQHVLGLVTALTILSAVAPPVSAQDAGPATRQAAVEAAQADKAGVLHPYVETSAERWMARVERMLSEAPRWHLFLESAYKGGGMPFGVGYTHHVSPFNYLDVRGSYSVNSYKRAEVEFVAPRLFHRRAQLAVIGGWRDATQVGFYGYRNDSSPDNRANYGFEEPHAAAQLTLRPTRKYFELRGGVELARWQMKPGVGGAPSVDEVYTPLTLPGLGSTTTYLHTQAGVGFDSRPAEAYARRGGYYGIVAHDYRDNDERFGFTQVDYEVVQHLPILREAWVISLHGLAETTSSKNGQAVPFYMLPSLGGGSNLRGYSSWRFRDRNSLLMQAEWRIMANRFIDTAVFYDAGKVASRVEDLDFNGLRHDYGFGVRFHSPVSTPLRVDLAKSQEGLTLVFATSAVF